MIPLLEAGLHKAQEGRPRSTKWCVSSSNPISNPEQCRRVTMPTFQYKAIDTIGHKRDGQLLARDKVELGRALGAMGLVLMKAVNLDEQEVGSKYKGSIGTRELIDFTHHLIMIFSSGIPLMVGLRDIRQEIPNENFRKVPGDVERGVESGQPLSDAFAAYPRIFDNHVTSASCARARSRARSRRCSRSWSSTSSGRKAPRARSSRR
jgi:hypothetical protein